MAQSQPPPTSSSYLEQCEAGVAKACFSYSLHLKKQRDPKAKQLASVYLRRACAMSYSPACSKREVKPVPANQDIDPDTAELLAHRNQLKNMVDQLQAKIAENSKLSTTQVDERMSVMEKMGFRATPLLVKIFGLNAFEFTSGAQTLESSKSEVSK